MTSPQTPPLDPRRHRTQTERQLLIGFIVIVYVFGGSLIWILYGRSAAILAWACLTALLGVVGLVALILWALGKFAGEG